MPRRTIPRPAASHSPPSLDKSPAFAFAKSLGYEGENAKLFLRQKAIVNGLPGMSLGHWLALVDALLELQDNKPPMVTKPLWKLVQRLRGNAFG